MLLDSSSPVELGPAWTESDRFQITAKHDQPYARVRSHPMGRTFLEKDSLNLNEAPHELAPARRVAFAGVKRDRLTKVSKLFQPVSGPGRMRIEPMPRSLEATSIGISPLF